jgi:hypothetical protein
VAESVSSTEKSMVVAVVDERKEAEPAIPDWIPQALYAQLERSRRSWIRATEWIPRLLLGSAVDVGHVDRVGSQILR